MTDNLDDIERLVAEITELIGQGFVKAARLLRLAYDQHPDLFDQVLKLGGIKRRKALYLVEIDRKLGGLSLDKQRLDRIGWTKTQIIAGHIDAQNATELLNLAERNAAHELKLMMEGGHGSKKRCAILYLEKSDYAVFEDVLIAHGAIRSGRGLSDKEEALMLALSKLSPAGGE
jgi:hypothetical protein